MYIVIETFDPEWPNICVDINGKPLIFDRKEDAEKLALDCQEPIILQIS